MKGKDKGCAQGCEQEYGTYACWECPDPNAPTHKEIMENEKKKEARSFEEILRNAKTLREWIQMNATIWNKGNYAGSSEFSSKKLIEGTEVEKLRNQLQEILTEAKTNHFHFPTWMQEKFETLLG